jgi:hypothetical protein
VLLRIAGAWVIATRGASVEGAGAGAGLYATGKVVFYLGIALCGKPFYLRMKAAITRRRTRTPKTTV